MRILRGIDAAIRWILYGLAFLFPLFFLPITQDFYDFNKWMLLVGSALFLALLWIIRMLISGEITISATNTVQALFFLSLASLISILGSPNKVEGALSLFGPITFAAAGVVLTITGTVLTEKTKEHLRWFVLSGGGILGLIVLYEYIGLGKLMFPNTYLADKLWTPIGGNIATILYLGGVLLYAISFFRKDLTEGKRIFIVACSLLLVVGIGLTAYELSIGSGWVVMPLSTAWVVMLETMKNWRHLGIGVGPANFLSAYTAGRPISINTTPFWNARFVTGASLFFHVMTTAGFLGGLGVLFLAKSLIPRRINFTSLAQIISICFLFIVPPYLSVVILLLWFLHADEKQVIRQWHTNNNWLLGWSLAAAVAVVVAVSVILAGRVYGAELTFFRSLVAAQANNGSKTYSLQQETIKQNPYRAYYHSLYSQTNLAIAIALVGQNGKTMLSPEDKQTITTLIQQAIREAKIATTIEPANVTYWENMGSIYHQLIGVADGADRWTIASYQQAIQLDPTNPLLRLNLGTVLAQLGKYDEAIQQFTLAASLKRDYANAYYNMASAYQKKGETALATEALQMTLQYVKAGTADYDKATKELTALRALQPSGQSSVPAPTPTPFFQLPETSAPVQ